MDDRPSASRRRIVATVAVIAGAAAAAMVVAIVAGPEPFPTSGTAVLAVLTLLGGLVTVRLANRHITVASLFAFSLVLTGPVETAIVSLLLGTAGHRVFRRAPPLIVAFTLGQQALALVLARAVYAAMTGVAIFGGPDRLHQSDLLAAVVAAAVYLIAGETAIGVIERLDNGGRLLRAIVRRITEGARTWGAWLAIAPALVAALQLSPLLVLPLVLPALVIIRALRRDEEVAAAALHDPLTGLPNRTVLYDRLTQLLAESGREPRGLALLLLDLDHFKDINDTLGHPVGDRLLHHVGERLSTAVRDADTVARLGGDEFAVLMSAITSPDDAVIVAERLMSGLRSAITLDDIKLDISTSIGIVVAPGHGTDADTLLQRADVALYTAKATRGCWELYTPESDPHTVERLGLLGELRNGIETGQLVVHYQPKANAVSGQIVGAEALVRWLHPERGMLAPDVFVPLAESTGLIGELTVVVLRHALAEVRTWMRAGMDWEVAVNLSARQLSDLTLPRDVEALLRDFGVPAERLTLEVTETTIMADPTRTLTVLRMLADIGVRLSVDDFGTGYSSLSHLRRLQAHEIKIDRSFIAGMATSSNDAVIVRSTIELGHNLGLSLVAEGVEDAATWRLLRDLGCDVIQGYHLSRPLPSDALAQWHAAYSPANATA